MVVSLPLFKLAALFVRHISKYGANHIKHQAHEHPRFRAFAAKYGQMMHQLNMRMSVLALRNADAEQRAKEAKEKAEAPTVKTEEQVRKEEELKAKYGVATPAVKSHPVKEPPKSIWRRKFRPLPEPKAVDLFADVIGDVFILTIASSLLLYEYYRSSSKPDANLLRIKDLERQLEEGKKREEEFLRMDEERKARLQAIEDALRAYKDPRTKRPIFPKPEDGAEHEEEQSGEGFALTRTFSGLAGKLGF
ncbi:optic atrophy 3 protein-domain-containing protein [Sordaria brevicollis]|uniref:Optic atrophy 3 protein-domain-containing protein n=1 Tax=Sordaria brevicollis TaxID=83679 RepID=A0AAE0P9K5_SORBR|nr:optic atrophy 3 protein-domain-containing protein [Sordaria brevicollis]